MTLRDVTSLSLLFILSLTSARATSQWKSCFLELDSFSPPVKRRMLTGFHPDQQKVKVAFFDADGTLRRSKSGTLVVRSREDIELLPFVASKLGDLHDEGYLIAIVSNQGGIPKHTTVEQTESLFASTVSELWVRGGPVHYFDFAENYDNDRKPHTGMAERMEGILAALPGGPFLLDKENSFMVGDAGYTPLDVTPEGTPGMDFSNSDRLFAENYGIEYRPPEQFFEWNRFGFSQAYQNTGDANKALDAVSEEVDERLAHSPDYLLYKHVLGHLGPIDLSPFDPKNIP